MTDDAYESAPLDPAFFVRPTEQVARDLLGKIVISTAGGRPSGGRIVETEAYLGSGDSGSHASTRGITPRNSVMYGPPGGVYVYFTYGNHHMLNFVCEPEGIAGAVLLRAIEPSIGIDIIRDRRRGRSDADLASGPGRLTQALGIDLSDNRTMLGAGRITVHEAPAPPERVLTSGRIGLSAGHEAQLRFFLEGEACVSKGRTALRKGPRVRDEPGSETSAATDQAHPQTKPSGS